MVLIMAALLLPTCPNVITAVTFGLFIFAGGAIVLGALSRQTSLDRNIPEEKKKLAENPERGMLITTMPEDDTCRLLMTLTRQAGCEVPQTDDGALAFDAIKEAPSGAEFRCHFDVVAYNGRTYIRYQTLTSNLSRKELEREAQHLLGGFIEWLPEGRVFENEDDRELIVTKLVVRERVARIEPRSDAKSGDVEMSAER